MSPFYIATNLAAGLWSGWDAWSAKAVGLKALWCNRFGQAPERIPSTPDGEIGDLSTLPDLVFR